MEQGSYTTVVSGSYMQSYRAEALQDYNSARAHDGLAPVSRMPKGTKYTRIEPVTLKNYSCDRCGYVTQQSTNHSGKTWSLGHFNTCPKCPPHAKYPEFGGMTTWTCVETAQTGK